MITVSEVRNDEEIQYSTADGEEISALGYQVDYYSRNTQNNQATDSVELMARYGNELLGGPNYKLNRVGTPALLPLIEDNTVMKLSIRYECLFDIKRNIIYKN